MLLVTAEVLHKRSVSATTRWRWPSNFQMFLQKGYACYLQEQEHNLILSWDKNATLKMHADI